MATDSELMAGNNAAEAIRVALDATYRASAAINLLDNDELADSVHEAVAAARFDLQEALRRLEVDLS